jgi:hypothetical protein
VKCNTADLGDECERAAGYFSRPWQWAATARNVASGGDGGGDSDSGEDVDDAAVNDDENVDDDSVDDAAAAANQTDDVTFVQLHSRDDHLVPVAAARRVANDLANAYNKRQNQNNYGDSAAVVGDGGDADVDAGHDDDADDNDCDNATKGGVSSSHSSSTFRYIETAGDGHFQASMQPVVLAEVLSVVRALERRRRQKPKE